MSDEDPEDPWRRRTSRRLTRVEAVQWVMLSLFGVTYGPPAAHVVVALVVGVWP